MLQGIHPLTCPWLGLSRRRFRSYLLSILLRLSGGLFEYTDFHVEYSTWYCQLTNYLIQVGWSRQTWSSSKRGAPFCCCYRHRFKVMLISTRASNGAKSWSSWLMWCLPASPCHLGGRVFPMSVILPYHWVVIVCVRTHTETFAAFLLLCGTCQFHSPLLLLATYHRM